MTQGDTKIAHAATAGDGGERVRHVKRGTEYEVLGEAEAQVSVDELLRRWDTGISQRLISDGDTLTVYRCATTGKLWCRFTDEFRDGRFETISTSPTPTDAQPKAARPVGDEAVDWHRLDDLFAKIPSGPWDAHRTGGGHEVRQLDTDPTNKHHWPFRLCQSVAGQRAQCDDAVFDFIAGVLNAWPQISTAVADAEVNRILGLSGDELRAEIIADGDNPDQMVADLDAKVSSTLEMFGRMQRAEAALHQISSQYFDNRGDMTDAEALEAIAFLAKSALASHPTTGQETVATPRDGGVGATRWGVEDTGDAIWVGPMRSDGCKIDRVVYFKDDLGLHRKEYVAQVKADARLIVDSVNAALSAPGSAGPGGRENGLLATLPPSIVLDCENQALNLAKLWNNGNEGARTCILAALLRIHAGYATPSPAQEPGTGDTGASHQRDMALEALHTLGVRLGVLDPAIACDGPQLLAAMSFYADSLPTPATTAETSGPAEGAR